MALTKIQSSNIADGAVSTPGIEDDIALLGFKVASNGSLSKYNLVDQTEDKFDGLRSQVLQGKNTKYDGLADVTIATVQTLESRLDHGMVPDPTLIFIDECHVQRKLYADLPQRHGSALIIGMTATPLHPSMGMLYETVVQGPSIRELINEGWLVQPRYYVPAEPDSPASRR